ncbi:hypothetical protein Vretimale_10642, partial [Volvox reticuliferus]
LNSHPVTSSRFSLAQVALSTGGGGGGQYCQESAEEAGGGAATAPAASAADGDDSGAGAIDPWDTLARAMTSTGLWRRQDLPPALTSAWGTKRKAQKAHGVGGGSGFGGGGGGGGLGRLLRGAAILTLVLLAARRGRKYGGKVRNVVPSQHRDIDNSDSNSNSHNKEKDRNDGDGGDVSGAPRDGCSADVSDGDNDDV